MNGKSTRELFHAYEDYVVSTRLPRCKRYSHDRCARRGTFVETHNHVTARTYVSPPVYALGSSAGQVIMLMRCASPTTVEWLSRLTVSLP